MTNVSAGPQLSEGLQCFVDFTFGDADSAIRNTYDLIPNFICIC